MKFRFSVELIFPHSEPTQDEVGRLLESMLEEGQRAFGHSPATMGYVVDKLRARSVDLDKPVGEQE